MKLAKMRIFDTYAPDVKLIHEFLSRDLAFNFQEIARALRSISFSSNFQGWVEEFDATGGVIEAGEEIQIVNRLGAIPSTRIIVGGTSPYIADGPSDWTINFIYLKNYGATDAENVRVLFLL